MTILDTFYILFKTDADDTAKQIRGVEKASDSVAQAFVGMASQAVAAAAAFVSLGAVVRSVFDAASVANGLYEVSKALGVNIEELSAWDDAVASSGGTAGDFQNDVRGLSEDLAKIATTGRSNLLPFFQELGIKVTDAHGKVKPVLDLFPQLADSLGKVSKQQALGIGQKLGLSQGTIMLLQQGRREVEAVLAKQRELGVITEKQALIAKKFNDKLQEEAHAYRTVALEVATKALPAYTEFLDLVERGTQFVGRHSDLVIGAFLGIAAAAAIAAVTTGFLFSPVVIVTAAIGALVTAAAALYDDFKTFQAGGDSLIGRVVDWANKFAVLRGIFQAVADSVKLVTSFLNAMGEAIERIANSNLGKLVRAMLSSIPGRLSESFDYDGGLKNAQNQLNAAGSAPLAAQSSRSIIAGGNTSSSRSTSVSVGEINVHTQATDAQGIGDAVGLTMGNSLRQATNTFDDGLHG